MRDNNEIKDYFNKKEKKFEYLKEINKLNLNERKQKVIDELLVNQSLSLEKLNYLLLMDNTNEELVYRYICMLKKSDVFLEKNRFSSYISLSKFENLQKKFFGNSNQSYRKFSYKDIFFQILSAIQKSEEMTINNILFMINVAQMNAAMNNQFFDFKTNSEAFYYYLCILLTTRIKKEKEDPDYLPFLKNYLDSLSITLNKYKRNDYEEEMKDLKNF